jgi:signal transduction histidine kinase/CheY-like chemotaxis protein
MNHWWRDLSITYKLYAVVGVMILLVGAELFTLNYSISTLSAIRLFVNEEASWSKSQKNAVLYLYQYASSRDESFYQEYLKNLEVPHQFTRARYALEAYNPDPKAAFEAFEKAGVDPAKIPNMIKVLRRLKGLPHMGKTADTWRDLDAALAIFEGEARKLHDEISESHPSSEDIGQSLKKLIEINSKIANLESDFSLALSKGADFLERAMIGALIFVVLVIGSLGIFLAYRFAATLTGDIDEIKNTALDVAQGKYDRRAKVKSKDELGQLAVGLNKMVEDLTTSIGKQEKAESANHIKSLFLANMSHEVRTPLGVILGLVEVLRSQHLSDKGREKYLEIIQRTGQGLEKIINDILDISKVEAGHLEVNQIHFNLQEFIEELNVHLQLLAQKGKDALTFIGEGQLPQTLYSDRSRLRQILVNLVGNALKFTQQGSVTVTYWMMNHQIYFKVKDTGIGISLSEREKLFKPFSQVDDASTRKYGGTGLGLLLSKRLSQSMGGDLILESSEPGVGSTFVFHVPAESHENLGAPSSSRPKEEATKTSKELQGRKILLVEDSVDNQMLIQLFLSEKGVSLDFANDGKEGVEKALTNKYDLVLMDMQMPVVDGYTATEQLRENGFKAPIIALTAHAMKEDRERCLTVGCDDYLTKPINLPLFYHTLANHMVASPPS